MLRLAQSPIVFDLTIFDEAHHLRNTDTLSHIVAQFICERSRVAGVPDRHTASDPSSDIVHLMEVLGVDVAEDPALLESNFTGTCN